MKEHIPTIITLYSLILTLFIFYLLSLDYNRQEDKNFILFTAVFQFSEKYGTI